MVGANWDMLLGMESGRAGRRRTREACWVGSRHSDGGCDKPENLGAWKGLGGLHAFGS